MFEISEYSLLLGFEKMGCMIKFFAWLKFLIKIPLNLLINKLLSLLVNLD